MIDCFERYGVLLERRNVVIVVIFLVCVMCFIGGFFVSVCFLVVGLVVLVIWDLRWGVWMLFGVIVFVCIFKLLYVMVMLWVRVLMLFFVNLYVVWLMKLDWLWIDLMFMIVFGWF